MRKQIILVDTDGMTEDRMNQIKKRQVHQKKKYYIEKKFRFVLFFFFL